MTTTYECIDVDGEEEGCPRCGTLLSAVPDLQLRYANCCGLCLCTDCINVSFRAGGRTMSCPKCETELLKKSFVESPFLQQKFDLEVRHRAKLNDVFQIFGRPDFESDQAYNDHLEFIEEIMFALAHGNADEIAEAEANTLAFKIKHSKRLAQYMSSKVAKQNLQRDAEVVSLLATESNDELIPVNTTSTLPIPNAPVQQKAYEGPKVLEPPVHTSSSPDTQQLSAKELRLHKYKKFIKTAMQRKAGGFKEGVAAAREIQAAQDLLLRFT